MLSREDAGRVAKLYWEFTLPIRKFMIDPSEEGKLVRCHIYPSNFSFYSCKHVWVTFAVAAEKCQ